MLKKFITRNLPSYPKVSVKFLHLTLGGSVERVRKREHEKFFR